MAGGSEVPLEALDVIARAHLAVHLGRVLQHRELDEAALPGPLPSLGKRIYGTPEFVAGRTGGDAHLAMIFEPTCNIAGIWSGYTGPGSKTIVPAEGHAKLDMRLEATRRPG